MYFYERLRVVTEKTIDLSAVGHLPLRWHSPLADNHKRSADNAGPDSFSACVICVGTSSGSCRTGPEPTNCENVPGALKKKTTGRSRDTTGNWENYSLTSIELNFLNDFFLKIILIIFK